MTPLLAGNDDLSLAGKVSKDAIDALTRQITAIEVVVEEKIDLRKPYDLLLSMPEVGRVLALTIMMETGPIERFPEVGNYEPGSLCITSREGPVSLMQVCRKVSR